MIEATSNQTNKRLSTYIITNSIIYRENNLILGLFSGKQCFILSFVYKFKSQQCFETKTEKKPKLSFVFDVSIYYVYSCVCENFVSVFERITHAFSFHLDLKGVIFF